MNWSAFSCARVDFRTQLNEEFAVASYWGIDVKRRKGRLAIDSARVLGQPGWRQNVVDIDTYGSPWKHWLAILGQLSRPTTVFLTIGQWQMGTAREILDALGIGRLKVPPGIAVRLHDLATDRLLGKALLSGVTILEAIEAIPSKLGSARYLGLHLLPQNPL